MAAELLAKLVRRREMVDADGDTFESEPSTSVADASHLTGLEFGNIPDVQEWLQNRCMPEEDRVAEVLAQLVAERGPRPAHAPELPSQDHAGEESLEPLDLAERERLKQLALQVQEAAQLLQEERERVSSKTAELAGQEGELKAKEDILHAREQALATRETLLVDTGASSKRKYSLPRWLDKPEGTVNVGVVGESGVGKSLLINTLRRVEPGATGWAPVGVSETTFAPKSYHFRNEPRVRLWDLPGAGTVSFPRDAYVATMGLRYFDSVLVVSAGRFMETEVLLARELRDHKVPYFMVRTKLDQDVENNRKDNGAGEDATVKQIRRDLQSRGVQHAYLVSSREPEKFDMEALLRDIFPHLETLLSSGHDYWEECWALPEAFSPMVTAIQGKWSCFFHDYYVHGLEVHITAARDDPENAVVHLWEESDRLWWQTGNGTDRWFLDEEAVHEFQKSSATRRVLRWKPSGDWWKCLRPFQWWQTLDSARPLPRIRSSSPA